MTKTKVVLDIRFAWWWTYLYLPGVRAMMWVTGKEVDEDKMVSWMILAMKCKIERCENGD